VNSKGVPPLRTRMINYRATEIAARGARRIAMLETQ
jgi:hypothetical protein